MTKICQRRIEFIFLMKKSGHTDLINFDKSTLQNGLNSKKERKNWSTESILINKTLAFAFFGQISQKDPQNTFQEPKTLIRFPPYTYFEIQRGEHLLFPPPTCGRPWAKTKMTKPWLAIYDNK